MCGDIIKNTMTVTKVCHVSFTFTLQQHLSVFEGKKKSHVEEK